jgi:hypothetical protein
MRAYGDQPPLPSPLAPNGDLIVYAAVVVAGVIVTGVVLPAVWSAKPARRAAARAVIEMLLRLVEGFLH